MSEKSFKEFAKIITEATKSTKSIKHAGFNKKVLILGYGSVGQPMVDICLRHIVNDANQLTVLEVGENEKLFKERNTGRGVKYVKCKIVAANLEKTLKKYTEKGGFVVDVSLNIDAGTIMRWCAENGVMYLNTSLERWESMADEKIPNLSDRTLYATHKEIRKIKDEYPNCATLCSTSGANPGLVTHLTKRALLKIAETTGKKVTEPTDKEGWAQLMKKLGVQVIHVAERDTQVIDKPKVKNEFCNTWSCEGFWAEGRAPSELGFGTHEPTPENGVVQGNAAFLKQPGLSVLVKSWVPKGGSYNGFLVQHSESVTMSEYFQTEANDFRPSVYYAYQPTDAAIASVHELRGRELDIQTKERIIKDEIISGIDELGVLLITNKGKCYWHGSQLSIEEARQLIPRENATSVQVAANILGTMMWAIQNPNRGYVEPEDMDYKMILEYATPYLGPVPFVPSDWRPEEDKNTLFKRPFDKKHPNALGNFRVWN